jgi:plasmid stabilization system protein ParE
MEIVWSETALDTFFKVIDYLFDNWSKNEIENFDNRVEALIQRIASQNQICPESKLFGYRKCVIDEHNSLVYDIVNDKLFLVTFLDNRSSHSY